MKRRTHAWAACLLAVAAVVAPAHAQSLPFSSRPPNDASVRAWLDGQLPGWLELYRHLHAHPELSTREAETAARVASELERAGFTVQRGIGGHGVVGVLDNGAGKTVMIRGDMDGLPVIEETGLSYASQVRVKDASGATVGVMHACGHDVHVTNLLAVAAFMASHRELWAGRLMIVAQPAEELGQGAADMLAAGVFERLGVPDYALALHVSPDLEAGKVGHISGWAFANVDSVDITIHGRGGHGARPHQANDPIVTAAHLITALQTLVSRRVDPQEAAVVTVGSLRAGTKHNVIPDSAHLQLTVRSYSDATRQILLEGIAQLARDICIAFQCSAPPDVVVKDDHTPAVYNDPELNAHAATVFRAVLGDDAVEAMQPTMGGEDFARYARTWKIPGLMFRLGAVAPQQLARSKRKGAAPLPSLHSSRFAPDAERALRTGVRTMTALALSLLRAP